MDKQIIQDFRKQICKLGRKLSAQLEDDSLCCGVTNAQCHTLLAIEEKGTTTITELAGELELDKSTLSRTIDGLVSTGLVLRETNVDNRRSQHLFLTSRGKKITAGINEQWNNYFELLLARTPESKQQILIEGLKLLAGVVLPFRENCCRNQVDNDKQPDGKTQRGKN